MWWDRASSKSSSARVMRAMGKAIPRRYSSHWNWTSFIGTTTQWRSKVRREPAASGFAVKRVDGLGPIVLEQTRERAIREQAPAGLAARAVVRLVVSVANALHQRPTDGARLAETAMHRHFGTKGGHLF